jgi:hypothetical protein
LRLRFGFELASHSQKQTSRTHTIFQRWLAQTILAHFASTPTWKSSARCLHTVARLGAHRTIKFPLIRWGLWALKPEWSDSRNRRPRSRLTRHIVFTSNLSRNMNMRHTLRRSCSACAKSKHSCDLATPRCSRCIKRNAQCLYANEPLTALAPPDAPETSGALTGYRLASLDPFESYPPTRLPRDHVHRLIHSCQNTSRLYFDRPLR